jgi:hypothetical protein
MTTDLNDEWMQFLTSVKKTANLGINNVSESVSNAAAATAAAAPTEPVENRNLPPLPEPTPLIISTKTKVLFLNQPIDITRIFWEIPIMKYHTSREGVVKKVVKMVCFSPEEQDALETRLAANPQYRQEIIKQVIIQTPTKNKFKDERKIIAGTSKKDIMACRIKKKNVFYNCFSLVVRILYKEFREIHVKIFNTGKMEIPGIVKDEILEITCVAVLRILRPFIGGDTPLDYIKQLSLAAHNVLINSNFNCGFHIHRERLHNILKSEKYYLDTSYDPCTYPGVKCKFYFNHELGFSRDTQRGKVMDCDKKVKMKNLQTDKKYTEVSIMIFRTGSGLIVGNCSDDVLDYIFHFILDILRAEYYKIAVLPDKEECAAAAATSSGKTRRKTVILRMPKVRAAPENV